MNPETIWAIALKDLRQFFRDRTLLLFLTILPLVQLLLLAQATARGIENVPLATIDYDRSSESRALLALMDASTRFEIALYAETWEQGERALERGEVFGLVIIPRGLAASLPHPGRTAPVQLVIDATNAIMARVIEATTQQVVQRFIQQRGGVATVGIQIEPAMLYNPSLSSRPHTISAQLGFITYQVTLGIAALALAREKEIGTLEQLMVTPVRRVELLLGKAIPPVLIGLLNFTILSSVIQYGFGIRIQGSFLFLTLGSLLFIFVEVIWGTMLSAVARTQQQAILLVFVQAMVDVALSGFLVPVRDMPAAFGFVARFVPISHYLVFVRAVVLKAAGPLDLWRELAALGGLGVLIAIIASFSISRNLD